MLKLSKILFTNEDSGDFSGAGTFQGGPYGFGYRHQLANSQIWPGTVDPAEDLPNNPSMWPAVHAQEQSDKEDYGSLESPEVYDDKQHLLPLEDEERDKLLDPKNDTEPSYFYVAERNASDALYRDLPGFPRMNTLTDPEDHVPEDQDSDREYPEEERYAVPNLLPSPREGDRGKPFGRGKYEDSSNLTLNKNTTDTNMYDPMNDEITNNKLDLLQKKNKSLNRWKETEQENRGHTNRDLVSNHLVAPQNFIKKSWGQNDYKKKLDEPDDVPIHAGSMGGALAHPVKHVPGPVNIYSNSSGYLKEAKTMKADKVPAKPKYEKYLPKDLEKKSPDETYGNGMGQTLKPYEFPAEDRKIKKHKPLEPEQNYIPYSYDRDRIDTIIQTKLFEKLAKLIGKD